jgi:hypothetical protein
MNQDEKRYEKKTITKGAANKIHAVASEAL